MSNILFAKKIIEKMKAAIGVDGQAFGGGTAVAAMTAVSIGVTEYLIEHTKVYVSYNGVIPSTPPAPDVAPDVFKIVGVCAPTGPGIGLETWLLQLQANIIAGFDLAPTGEAGLSFPTKAFLAPGVKTTLADLTAAHSLDDKEPQLKIWAIICQGIMDWINTSAMNTVPGAASRPISSGVATISKIVID